MTALIAVAHGSRDPRSAATVRAAVDLVRHRRPDLDVRTAFLDLNEPTVAEVIDSVAADGHRTAVVVPLLLGSAFHARVDLPQLLDAARARHRRLTLTQSNVLGDDKLLVDVVRQRIVATGCSVDDPGVGVALAAVGSSDPTANGRTRSLAGRLIVGTTWSAQICFATAPTPHAPQAISRLRSAGATRLVLAPWFLAPGLLLDRVAASLLEHDVSRSDVIGAHPLVAELVSRRYDAALASLATEDAAVRASA